MKDKLAAKTTQPNRAAFFSQSTSQLNSTSSSKSWWQSLFANKEPEIKPNNPCEGNEFIYLNPNNEMDVHTKAFAGMVNLEERWTIPGTP